MLFSCKTRFTNVRSLGTSDGVWHVDSGAGLSITGDRSLFSDFSLLQMDQLLNLVMG